jgi:hypothetical protein
MYNKKNNGMKKIIIAALAISFCMTTNAQKIGLLNIDKKNHPDVNQVNKRIVSQEKRIYQKEQQGTITKQQAREHLKTLALINREKKEMRKRHNGHLTVQDQKILNQQLDQNNKKI